MKISKFLALALASPMTSLALASNVITDADVEASYKKAIIVNDSDVEIEEAKEHKVGGTYITKYDRTYKIEGIKDPLSLYGLNTAGTRMEHSAYLVNLRELAEKARGSKMNFNMKEEGDKIYITLGEDYKGPASKTLDLKEYYRPDELEFTEVKLVVKGKEYPVDLNKAYGEIYLRFKDAQNIIYNKGIEDFKTVTTGLLQNDIKAADYTVIYSYTYDYDYPHILKSLNDLVKDMAKEGKYKVQLVAINRDWDAYSADELALNLDLDKLDFTHYKGDNIDENTSKFLNSLSPDGTYPIVVDKNMKVVAKAPATYYEDLVGQFIKKEKITRDEYENNIYGKYDDNGKYGEVDKALREASIKYYLDYSIGGKKVSLDDLQDYDSNKTRKEDLLAQKASLEKALVENKTIIGSATFLLEYTPQTIVKVKDKLVKQLENAKVLQKEAEVMIKDLEKEIAKL